MKILCLDNSHIFVVIECAVVNSSVFSFEINQAEGHIIVFELVHVIARFDLNLVYKPFDVFESVCDDLLLDGTCQIFIVVERKNLVEVGELYGCTTLILYYQRERELSSGGVKFSVKEKKKALKINKLYFIKKRRENFEMILIKILNKSPFLFQKFFPLLFLLFRFFCSSF